MYRPLVEMATVHNTVIDKIGLITTKTHDNRDDETKQKKKSEESPLELGTFIFINRFINEVILSQD